MSYENKLTSYRDLRDRNGSNDILRAVNGAVSSVGDSAGLRLPGGNIPVTLDGTQVCAPFFGTVRAW